MRLYEAGHVLRRVRLLFFLGCRRVFSFVFSPRVVLAWKLEVQAWGLEFLENDFKEAKNLLSCLLTVSPASPFRFTGLLT